MFPPELRIDRFVELDCAMEHQAITMHVASS